MTVRELLQIEIWSKKTSRNLVLLLAVLFVGAFLVAYVSDHWLTHSERDAARAALLQLDSMQLQVSEEGDRVSRTTRQQAIDKVEYAEKVALTGRDQRVSTLLSNYLMTMITTRFETRAVNVMKQRRDAVGLSTSGLDQSADYSPSRLKENFSVPLHNALDK
jgi:hypothetical protein